jgi:hypothetical protein
MCFVRARSCGLFLLVVHSLSAAYGYFISDISAASLEDEFLLFVAKYNKSYVRPVFILHHSALGGGGLRVLGGEIALKEAKI